MSTKMRWEPVDFVDVQPGDIANHVDGHDGREVAKVTAGGVWLYLLTDEPQGPFPLENYTFKRLIEEV